MAEPSAVEMSLRQELDLLRARQRRTERALAAAGIALEHWREAALWTGHNRPHIVALAREATVEYDRVLALTRAATREGAQHD